MTNEEKAVIAAARAIAHSNPHPASGLALELRDAVQALDAAEPANRRLWVNYQYTHAYGRGEGSASVSIIGAIHLECVKEIQRYLVDLVARTADVTDVNLIIRTWTELED